MTADEREWSSVSASGQGSLGSERSAVPSPRAAGGSLRSTPATPPFASIRVHSRELLLSASMLALLAATLSPALLHADDPLPAAATIDTSRGDRMIAAYFRAETARLAERCLADVKSLDDWTSRRDELRRQLREML